MPLTVELTNKQNGKRYKHLAVFKPDNWLEVRPKVAAIMEHQISAKEVKAFLAGERVHMSYTYWVQQVAAVEEVHDHRTKKTERKAAR